MVAGGPSADYSRVSVGETENALVAGVTAIWLNTQHRLAVWTLAQGVAKLAKNFGMPLSVLYVGDELIPFLRGLTKNSKVSSLEVSAFTRVAPKVLATFATDLGALGASPGCCVEPDELGLAPKRLMNKRASCRQPRAWARGTCGLHRLLHSAP